MDVTFKKPVADADPVAVPPVAAAIVPPPVAAGKPKPSWLLTGEERGGRARG